mgnify:CR=1 FL=1
MTAAEDIRHLEAVLAGNATSALRPPAVRGRLAQLYLQDREAPGRAGAALRLAEEGLAEVDRDDPLYPKLLHVLAMALRLAEGSGDEARGADSRAARLDRDSWLLSLDPAPQEAVATAREWADWAWSQELWAEAADAYDGAEIALARLVLRETPEPADRLNLLAEHALNGPRGAYAYARTHQVREAVVLLERSGSLLSRSGEQARAIEQLATVGREDLRDRLRAASREVESARAQAPPDAYGRRSPGQIATQAKLDAVVREIRGVPGFASFATGGGWNDVRRASAACPVAYLAPTDKGTVALIVQQGAESVSLGVWDATLEQIHDGVREFLTREFGDDPADSREALIEALEWLGLALMRGVREAVGDGPVVLVPFGMLAFLPLHAALVHLNGPDPSTPRIHILFHPKQVSYAYSARALADARERVGASPAPSSALVINNPVPLPATFDPLPLADFERDVVGRYLPVTELKGPAATGAAIIDALPGADVAHFSCHGTVDRDLRYSGILLVADRRAIAAQHLAGLTLHARLVVLSACRTGAPAIGVSQVVSLPSALVTAGAAGVIGTLWRAEEMATLLVVTKFYELWQGGAGMSPQEALGTAQGWLALATAGELRGYAPAEALNVMNGRTPLAGAEDDARPYGHPWFWAPFFLVGV